MVAIPKPEKTLSYLINSGKSDIKPHPGNYLPMSSIGMECYRALQYRWRFATDPVPNSNQAERIFSLGNYLENKVVEDLEKLGVKVTRQQETVYGFAGVWKGKIDGVAENVPDSPTTPMLLEIKSINAAKLRSLKNKQSVKEAIVEHYAQTQIYMNYLGFDRGLYVAVCKDNSEYYVEILKADYDYQRELRKKEADICTSDALFPRIGEDPDYYKCRFCNQKAVCYENVRINQSCRSCEHSDVHNENKWHCTFHGKDLELNEQIKGCEHYEKEEMFITIKETVHGIN